MNTCGLFQSIVPGGGNSPLTFTPHPAVITTHHNLAHKKNSLSPINGINALTMQIGAMTRVEMIIRIPLKKDRI